MKNKTCCLLASALALTCFTSCFSGPRRMTRSFDGWVNQQYSDDSRIHGALLQDIIPVYPLVGFLATIVDVIIVNPYYFWSRDIWKGTGTAYTYEQVSDPTVSVSGSGL